MHPEFDTHSFPGRQRATPSDSADGDPEGSERRHLVGRIRELERRITSQRAEIESLRRAVILGRAERDRLLGERTPSPA